MHYRRLLAILFSLMLLFTQHTFSVSAAEENGTVLPEEGKLYGIRCVEPTGQERNLMFYTMVVTEDAVLSDSFLSYNTIVPNAWVDTAFYFEKTDEGYYRICPLNMPGWYLEWGDSSFGKTIHAGRFAEKPEQLWILKPLDDGGFYISNATAPDRILGYERSTYYLELPESKAGFTFFLEEKNIEFPKAQIHIKSPQEWHPGIWVMQLRSDDETKWGGQVVMEKGTDDWYSFAAPWEEACKIVNYARKGVGEQNYEHDEVFDIVDIDFSTDKWIIISDDPNVEGDLTYKIYDYNPDEEPPKTADPVMLAVPALGLLASAIALSYLLRRRKPA